MKIVNRGYLKVKAKRPFIDWATATDADMFIDEDTEANIYLVEEDFFDVEPIIKANFKRIFLNELDAVTEDETAFPEIKLEVFEAWFNVEAGTMVFDCEKDSILSE
ncbi:MAG: hypothetical protein MK105_17320 [Crocinitomicaceae bacterium]|nr:hypothetical protein [Crocinitomicaceae bacterium]